MTHRNHHGAHFSLLVKTGKNQASRAGFFKLGYPIPHKESGEVLDTGDLHAGLHKGPAVLFLRKPFRKEIVASRMRKCDKHPCLLTFCACLYMAIRIHMVDRKW